jgi:hypothetical protein
MFCIGECEKKYGCAGFSLNVDTCWLKDSGMMAASPQYKGESSRGWTWLYAKQGSTSAIQCCTQPENCTGSGVNASTRVMRDCLADEVTDQSMVPDEQPTHTGAPGEEIQLALNTYQLFHQSACGSFTTLLPEDCSAGSWVMTIKWSQVRQTCRSGCTRGQRRVQHTDCLQRKRCRKFKDIG